MQNITQASANSAQMHSKNGDWEAALKRCIALVGLRPANLPTPEEKALLLDFILRRYRDYTPEHLVAAFELAITGDLDVDTKHYECFSCEYIGRILKAYKSYLIRTGQIKTNYERERQYIPPQRQLTAGQHDWSHFLGELRADIEAGKVYTCMIPVKAYNWLVLRNKVQLDYWKEFVEQARAELIKENNESKTIADAIRFKNSGGISENAVKVRAGQLAIINYLKHENSNAATTINLA